MNIQLQNVTYTYAGKYQRVTAVDGVSYTFHDGTLYTIMGASGSGKSTLLSLLAGLKLPTEGEITLDEQPIRLMDRSALRRDTVSVIYQDFNLFPLLTAEENVCYPLRLQKMDKEKALELARRLEGKAPIDFPPETALGALALYVSNETVEHFQPMNINFGIMPPLGYRVKGKRNKNAALSQRSLEILAGLEELGTRKKAYL